MIVKEVMTDFARSIVAVLSHDRRLVGILSETDLPRELAGPRPGELGRADGPAPNSTVSG